MTTAFDQDRARRRGEGAAANDDHVGSASAPAQALSPQIAPQTSQTGGWDAYDVWRRLIKEARERRAGRSFPQQA
jgi:hypothetical protein